MRRFGYEPLLNAEPIQPNTVELEDVVVDTAPSPLALDRYKYAVLYRMIVNPPAMHDLMKAAQESPYFPTLLKSLVLGIDGYLEALPNWLAPAPWIFGFYFSDVMKKMAESMLVENSSNVTVKSLEIILSVSGYGLGSFVHKIASKIYVYYRGERKPEFPNDFLAEIKKIAHPILPKALIEPETEEDFKEFYAYWSEFVIFLIQENDLEAAAKALLTIWEYFPYEPSYLHEDSAPQPILQTPEIQEQSITATEVFGEVGPEFQQEDEEDNFKKRMIAKIIEENRKQAISEGRIREDEQFHLNWGCQKLPVRHIWPQKASEPAEIFYPVSTLSSPQMIPVDIEPEIQPMRNEYFDPYSFDILSGRENARFVHMPDAAPVDIPGLVYATGLDIEHARSRRERQKLPVNIPNPHKKNMAVLITEAVGRVLQDPPHPHEEHYSTTDFQAEIYLRQFFRRGGSLCARFLKALEKFDHEEVNENPPLHPYPYFHLNSANPPRIQAQRNADLPTRNLLIQATDEHHDSVVIPELQARGFQQDIFLERMNAAPRAQSFSSDDLDEYEALPFAEEGISFVPTAPPAVTSQSHNRALRRRCLLNPSSARSEDHVDWQFNSYVSEEQFYRFMSQKRWARVVTIFDLMSGYPADKVWGMSYLQSEKMSSRGFQKFLNDYLRYFEVRYFSRAEGVAHFRRVLADHLYFLTSLTTTRSLYLMRVLFRKSPDLAVKILLALTHADVEQDFYVMHAQNLFLRASVNSKKKMVKRLEKGGHRECLLKLLIIPPENTAAVLGHGHNENQLEYLIPALENEDLQIRKAAYRFIATHIMSEMGYPFAESFALYFGDSKAGGRLARLRGELNILRNIFLESGEARAKRAFAYLSFALVKQVVLRKSALKTESEAQHNEKSDKIIQILRDFFPGENLINIFIEMGDKLRDVRRWTGNISHFKRVFKYCLGNRAFTLNEAFQQLILAYNQNIRNEDQLVVLGTLVQALIEWCFPKGKDIYNFREVLEQNRARILQDNCILDNIGQAICSLNIPKERVYEHLGKFLMSYFPDAPDKMRAYMGGSFRFLQTPNQNGQSFADMWLTAAINAVRKGGLDPAIQIMDCLLSQSRFCNLISQGFERQLQVLFEKMPFEVLDGIVRRYQNARNNNELDRAISLQFLSILLRSNLSNIRELIQIIMTTANLHRLHNPALLDDFFLALCLLPIDKEARFMFLDFWMQTSEPDKSIREWMQKSRDLLTSGQDFNFADLWIFLTDYNLKRNPDRARDIAELLFGTFQSELSPESANLAMVLCSAERIDEGSLIDYLNHIFKAGSKLNYKNFSKLFLKSIKEKEVEIHSIIPFLNSRETVIRCACMMMYCLDEKLFSLLKTGNKLKDLGLRFQFKRKVLEQQVDENIDTETELILEEIQSILGALHNFVGDRSSLKIFLQKNKNEFKRSFAEMGFPARRFLRILYWVSNRIENTAFLMDDQESAELFVDIETTETELEEQNNDEHRFELISDDALGGLIRRYRVEKEENYATLYHFLFTLLRCNFFLGKDENGLMEKAKALGSDIPQFMEDFGRAISELNIQERARNALLEQWRNASASAALVSPRLFHAAQKQKSEEDEESSNELTKSL